VCAVNILAALADVVSLPSPKTCSVFRLELLHVFLLLLVST